MAVIKFVGRSVRFRRTQSNGLSSSSCMMMGALAGLVTQCVVCVASGRNRRALTSDDATANAELAPIASAPGIVLPATGADAALVFVRRRIVTRCSPSTFERRRQTSSPLRFASPNRSRTDDDDEFKRFRRWNIRQLERVFDHRAFVGGHVRGDGDDR